MRGKKVRTLPGIRRILRTERTGVRRVVTLQVSALGTPDQGGMVSAAFLPEAAGHLPYFHPGRRTSFPTVAEIVTVEAGPMQTLAPCCPLAAGLRQPTA